LVHNSRLFKLPTLISHHCCCSCSTLHLFTFRPVRLHHSLAMFVHTFPFYHLIHPFASLRLCISVRTVFLICCDSVALRLPVLLIPFIRHYHLPRCSGLFYHCYHRFLHYLQSDRSPHYSVCYSMLLIHEYETISLIASFDRFIRPTCHSLLLPTIPDSSFIRLPHYILRYLPLMISDTSTIPTFRIRFFISLRYVDRLFIRHSPRVCSTLPHFSIHTDHSISSHSHFVHTTIHVLICPFGSDTIPPPPFIGTTPPPGDVLPFPTATYRLFC